MQKIFHLGGTVRYLNNLTWSAIRDLGHEPVGIGDVQIFGGDRVRVFYTEPVAKVITFSATVDESFSSAGVRCGASVGLEYADIFFYMGTSSTPIDPGILSKSGANVWLSGTFLPSEKVCSCPGPEESPNGGA